MTVDEVTTILINSQRLYQTVLYISSSNHKAHCDVSSLATGATMAGIYCLPMERFSDSE